MNRQLSMPSLVCSRINLRKNSLLKTLNRLFSLSASQLFRSGTVCLPHISLHVNKKRGEKAFFSLIILFTFILLPVYASGDENVDVVYSIDSSKSLFCSVNVEPFKTRNILNSMEIGHRTQIEYNIRVYKNKRKFIGLFGGDRLVHDISSSYVATKDPFSDTFYITSSDGDKIVQKDADSFFRTFFSLNDLKIDMKKAGRGEYYITSKIEMKIIKLMPPLNLLSSIIPGIVERTDWSSAGSFWIK